MFSTQVHIFTKHISHIGFAIFQLKVSRPPRANFNSELTSLRAKFNFTIALYGKMTGFFKSCNYYQTSAVAFDIAVLNITCWHSVHLPLSCLSPTMADGRANRTGIRNSETQVQHIWGVFYLWVFKVIFVTFDTTLSNIPHKFKCLVIERNVFGPGKTNRMSKFGWYLNLVAFEVILVAWIFAFLCNISTFFQVQ